jgi:hypothetical protein
LIVVEGLAPILIDRVSVEQDRQLGGAELPIRHEGEHSYTCNLTRLDIAVLSDSDDDPQRSRLVLTEDGVPLRPHALHDDIRTGAGCFSHWGVLLYFSSRDGSDPTGNGRNYVIHYRAARAALWEMVSPCAYSAAVILLLALAAGSVSRPIILTASSRWSAIAMLGSALAISLLTQVWRDRHRFAINPDSAGYTETPDISMRPPGYYAFMAAASNPARVRTEVLDLVHQGQDGVVQEGSVRQPIARVVVAQGLVLVCALIGAFFAFQAIMPSPLAAAIILLIGQFAPKVPVSRFTAVAAVAGLLVLLFLGMTRRSGRERLPAVGAFLLAAFALAAVLPMALQRTLIPNEHYVLCSETAAMAAETWVMLSLVRYIVRGRTGWVWSAALAAAAAFLIRPAAVFAFVAVFGAAGAMLCRRNHREWISTISALASGAVLAALPGLVNRAAHAQAADVSMLRWGLATYALTVAEPADAGRIHDPVARELLEQALPARNKMRTGITPPPGWGYDAEVYRFDSYQYEIILPISEQIARRTFPGTFHERESNRNRILWEMAAPIYRTRWRSLALMFAHSFAYAVGSGTRLSQTVPWWMALIGVAALAVLARNPIGWAGLTLCAAHLAHLAIVCAINAPLVRYIRATEFLSVIGVFLVIWAGMVRVTRPPDSSVGCSRTANR